MINLSNLMTKMAGIHMSRQVMGKGKCKWYNISKTELHYQAIQHLITFEG